MAQLLDHVSITVSDLDRACVFYDAIFGALGVERLRRSEERARYGEPVPSYHEHYYGAFLIDPDGNRVEAVCHEGPARPA